jgi:hypothetical protein
MTRCRFGSICKILSFLLRLFFLSSIKRDGEYSLVLWEMWMVNHTVGGMGLHSFQRRNLRLSAWRTTSSKSIPHPNTTFQDLQFWFKISHSRDTINCSLPENFHDHFAFPISDEYCTRRSAPDYRPCEIYTLQRVERCTIVRLFPVPNLMTQWKLMMVDFSGSISQSRKRVSLATWCNNLKAKPFAPIPNSLLLPEDQTSRSVSLNRWAMIL